LIFIPERQEVANLLILKMRHGSVSITNTQNKERLSFIGKPPVDIGLDCAEINSDPKLMFSMQCPVLIMRKRLKEYSPKVLECKKRWLHLDLMMVQPIARFYHKDKSSYS